MSNKGLVAGVAMERNVVVISLRGGAQTKSLVTLFLYKLPDLGLLSGGRGW